MDSVTHQHFNNLHLDDANIRYASFQDLIRITNQPVDWAYEVWDDLLLQLKHKNNHQRAIAAQLLSNLAKSDTAGRMITDFEKLFAVTYDEKFVTARHALQSLWKVAIVYKDLVVAKLTERFENAMAEKNGTLIRYDISEIFRRIYDVTKDETLKEKSMALIETEGDLKYRKKYAGVWKK